MNFCFVIDDVLSASSQPGKNRRVTDYLQLYKENGIRVLVSLYKKIDVPKEFQNTFTTYFYKLSDMDTPNVIQIDEAVDTVIRHLRKKEAVNVNCAAGIGHSGMILIATLMKYYDLDYQSAFSRVTEQRYAEEQEFRSSLKDYEKHLARAKPALAR